MITNQTRRFGLVSSLKEIISEQGLRDHVAKGYQLERRMLADVFGMGYRICDPKVPEIRVCLSLEGGSETLPGFLGKDGVGDIGAHRHSPSRQQRLRG